MIHFLFVSLRISRLVALQHTLDQVTQRTPVVFATALLQTMFVDEEDIVLKTCVQVWLKS